MSKKTKQKTGNLCKVCFNVATPRKTYRPSVCEACQKFFRRNCVHPELLKCAGENSSCTLFKGAQSCPRCRFDKCISVGMTSRFFAGGQAKPNKKRMSISQDSWKTISQENSSDLAANFKSSGSSGSSNLSQIINNNETGGEIVDEISALVPIVRQPVAFNGSGVEDVLRTAVRAYTTLHDLEFLTLKRPSMSVTDLPTVLRLGLQHIESAMAVACSYGQRLTAETSMELSYQEFDELKGTALAHVGAVFHNLPGNPGAALYGLNNALAPIFLAAFPVFTLAMESCQKLGRELEAWNPTLVETALLLGYLFFSDGGNSKTGGEKFKRFRDRFSLAFNLHCSAVCGGDTEALQIRQDFFQKCQRLTKMGAKALLNSTVSLSQRMPFFASVTDVMNCSSDL